VDIQVNLSPIGRTRCLEGSVVKVLATMS
jgi:hypothetical protein